MSQTFDTDDYKAFLTREIEKKSRVCVRLSNGEINPQSGTGREIMLMKSLLESFNAPKKLGVNWSTDRGGGFVLDAYIPGVDMMKIKLEGTDDELVSKLLHKNTASCVLQALTIWIIAIEKLVTDQRKQFIKDVDSQTGGPAAGSA